MDQPTSRTYADLALLAALTLLADATLLTDALPLRPAVGTSLRILLGAPLLAFFPGYALLAALVPHRGPGQTDTEPPRAVEDESSTALQTLRKSGLSAAERTVLGFCISVLLVPLVAVALMSVQLFSRAPIVAALSVFVLACTGVGAVRRARLPPEERYGWDADESLAALRSVVDVDAPADAVVTVALVLSALFLVGSVAYAATGPQRGPAYTEFSLLAQTDSGEYAASGYPTNLSYGRNESFAVGIGNHESQRESYTVVVELQRVRETDSGMSVLEERELDRMNVVLGVNETRRIPHTITPTLLGDRLRLQYLLYRDEVPANPTHRTAYRHVRHWVNVSATAG
jgi:uncharacterized membrane protein